MYIVYTVSTCNATMWCILKSLINEKCTCVTISLNDMYSDDVIED